MQQAFFNNPTPEKKKPTPKKGKGSKKGNVNNKAKAKAKKPNKDIFQEKSQPNACSSIENEQDTRSKEETKATEEGTITIERSNTQMKNSLNSSNIENMPSSSDFRPDVVASESGDKQHPVSCDCTECDEMDYLLGFVNGQPYGIK